MVRITGTPGQKGAGAFLAGLAQSARGQLAKGREKKDTADAAEAERQQKVALLNKEYELKAGLQAGAPSKAGRTTEQSFADWRRATDPSGFMLESSFARGIYDAERATKARDLKPEALAEAQQNLSTLWDLNRRAASETMRRMVQSIKAKAAAAGVTISDDAAWKQAMDFKKAGYTVAE